jgi:hypothetical protein
VPEVYGCPLGIPLFTYQQTTAYNPTPATVAGQKYYDFFIASQNRRRLSVWFDGVGKNGRRQKPGWRSFGQYLSRSKVREHLRGRKTYAVWGNELTNWFELDVDHHGGDGRYFLGVLEALQDLPAFFPDWRWAYSIRRDDLTGVHVIGLLPNLSRMDVIKAEYPNQPLPGTLVPTLCASLPVRWEIPSDNGRCKRAEKFLRLLCALGVIKVLRKKHWHDPGHPSNEATIYGLPQDQVLEPEGDLGRRWYLSSWTRRQGQEEREPHPYQEEGEPSPYPETTCIYIHGRDRFTPEDLEAIASEVERLSRAWSPKFHSSG